MSELTYRKLSADEANSKLSEVPGWAISDGALARSFPFENYMDGVRMLHHIAELAEALNHHPDMTLVYRRLDVELSTHDSAGLTAYDFEMAKRINALLPS